MARRRGNVSGYRKEESDRAFFGIKIPTTCHLIHLNGCTRLASITSRIPGRKLSWQRGDVTGTDALSCHLLVLSDWHFFCDIQ